MDHPRRLGTLSRVGAACSLLLATSGVAHAEGGGTPRIAAGVGLVVPVLRYSNAADASCRSLIGANVDFRGADVGFRCCSP